jgi:hypothetical protein
LRLDLKRSESLETRTNFSNALSCLVIKEMEDLTPLKNLYDELWRDARTMIKDMNKGIKSVFFFGLVMFALVPIELGTAIDMYARYSTGSTRWLDYLYLGGGAIGSVVCLLAGVTYMRFYFKLKRRYANLIELEKTLEE